MKKKQLNSQFPGLYFNINLILVLVSVVLTIIVLNFHFRGPKKQRVPRWMRKFVIGYMGRAFCFCYESRAYYMAHEEMTVDKNDAAASTSSNCNKQEPFGKASSSGINEILNNTYKNKNKKSKFEHNEHTDSDADDFENKFKPAYVKASLEKNSSKYASERSFQRENHVVIEYSNETDLFLSQRQLNQNFFKKSPTNITILKTNNHNIHNDSNKKQFFSSTPSHLNTRRVQSFANTKADSSQYNEEISKNLEKMLLKMQKSIDPFKLKDENLKFSILKEILECQRLLLTANLTSSDNGHKSHGSNSKINRVNNSLTLNDIYDEWKILAMIVDRICFFFYLLALVLSSAVFFMREQIYNEGHV